MRVHYFNESPLFEQVSFGFKISQFECNDPPQCRVSRTRKTAHLANSGRRVFMKKLSLSSLTSFFNGVKINPKPCNTESFAPPRDTRSQSTQAFSSQFNHPEMQIS